MRFLYALVVPLYALVAIGNFMVGDTIHTICGALWTVGMVIWIAATVEMWRAES